MATYIVPKTEDIPGRICSMCGAIVASNTPAQNLHDAWHVAHP